MAVKLDQINIKEGESIFLNIQGSSERSLFIHVTKDERCFVAGLFSTKRDHFELTLNGMKSVSKEEWDKSLGK